MAAVNRKKSRPLNLDDFEGGIEWDPEDYERSNLAHCLVHDVDEQVVDEVLYGDWVDIKTEVGEADFAIVGPNLRWNYMWTLLFAQSEARGDMLRPVTGWPARPKDIREWERATGKRWTGSRQKYPN